MNGTGVRVRAIGPRLVRIPCVSHRHGPFKQPGLGRKLAETVLGWLSASLPCISSFVRDSLSNSVSPKARVVRNGVDVEPIAGL